MEPRVVARPYTLLNLEVLYWRDKMNVFIASSSSDAVLEKYGTMCSELIEKVAKLNDSDLVFGVYSKGLMGKCYDSFKQEQKRIIGIAVKEYEEEFEKIPCDEKVIVKSSMERLETIYNKSDILLFLPGGVGTYNELFACLEEMKTNSENKKLILYNIDFFFSPMLEEMYKLYQQGFLEKNLADYIFISNNQDEIIDKIKEKI